MLSVFRKEPTRKQLSTELQECREALVDANTELQTCVSALFEQRRQYEEKLAHLAELLQGSTCTIGGIEFRYKS